MLEYVIDPNKEFDGYSYHILSDGVNPYTGETKEQYIEQGFFTMKQNVFSVDGEMRTRNTTKVTGKGQIYFINKFIGVSPTG